MEGLESLCHMNENSPDLLLCECLVIFLVLDDLLVQVAIISVFHDHTSLIFDLPEAIVFDEGLLITDNVWVVNRGQDADFVESILLFFFGQSAQFHFL